MRIKYVNPNISKQIIAFTLVGTLSVTSLVDSAHMIVRDTRDTLNQGNGAADIASVEKQVAAYEVEQNAYFAEENEELTKVSNVENSSYWWPIGSEETVNVDNNLFAKADPYPTAITSNYGYRIHPISGTTQFHSGVDIAGSAGNGIVNIIAAKDGVVVYPTADVNNSGGYGNYIIIEHSDGNFTLYAHLHPNSITVTAGDIVKQGQVIGKMGSSGYSTGTHLHFEVRVGQNDSSATINPLEYISLDNPRIITMDNMLVTCSNNCEGHTKIENGNYIVEYCSDEEVSLEYNPQKIKIK